MVFQNATIPRTIFDYFLKVYKVMAFRNATIHIFKGNSKLRYILIRNWYIYIDNILIYIDNKVRVTSLSNGFPPIFAILHTIKEIHSFSWKKSLHKSILIEGLMIRVAIDHPFVSSFFIKTQVFTDCVFITQMTKCSPVVVYLFLLTCFF